VCVCVCARARVFVRAPHAGKRAFMSARARVLCPLCEYVFVCARACVRACVRALVRVCAGVVCVCACAACTWPMMRPDSHKNIHAQAKDTHSTGIHETQTQETVPASL
jgi:hypothetical protein